MVNRRLCMVLALLMLFLPGCQSWKISRFIGLPEGSKKAAAAAPASLPVDPGAVKGGARMAEQLARDQQKPQVLRHSRYPWIAAAPMPFREDQRLPPVFYELFSLNYSMDEAGMSMDMLAHRLSQIAKVPVRVLPDVYAGIEQSVAVDESEAVEEEDKRRQEALKADQTARRPAAGRSSRFEIQEIPAHLLRWRGNLRNFLNHLTDRLDLSWSYEDGTIVLSRFQTESFELAMFPTRGTYNMRSNSSGSSGARGGGGGGGGSATTGAGASAGSVTGNMAMDYSEQGQLDAYDSTIKLIESLISTVPGSRVFVTQGSGRIMVRSSRLMLRTLREIIRSENASLTRQVLVQVDIYNITSNSKREFAMDWTAVYQRLFPGIDMALNSTPAGGVGVFNLPDSRAGLLAGKVSADTLRGAPRNVQTVITALSEMGYAVQHRPVNVMAMNRQWVRKSKLLSQSYLAETTAAAAGALGGGTGVPGLKAASVTVGDQIMLMPFILENNSVMIKFSVSFSDLLGLNRIETGEGATRQLLQIPTTSTVQDNFTVNIKPGEVVAITGLGTHSDTETRKSLTESASTWLGGSEVAEKRNQHFLVFLRVVML